VVLVLITHIGKPVRQLVNLELCERLIVDRGWVLLVEAL